MHLFCDRCNEAVDHPIGITQDPELSEIAKDLGYRSVCSGCYDDLVAEVAEMRELHGDGDRRHEPRIAASLRLCLEPADGSGPAQEVVTDDVSTSGVRVRGVRAIEPGSVVRISADGSGDADAIAIVELVWQDDDGMHAGLRLVDASESWSRLVAERAGDRK
jgi:hypothetical protein